MRNKKITVGDLIGLMECPHVIEVDYGGVIIFDGISFELQLKYYPKIVKSFYKTYMGKIRINLQHD